MGEYAEEALDRELDFFEHIGNSGRVWLGPRARRFSSKSYRPPVVKPEDEFEDIQSNEEVK